MAVVTPPGRQDIWTLEIQMERALNTIEILREEVIQHKLAIQKLQKEIEKIQNI